MIQKGKKDKFPKCKLTTEIPSQTLLFINMKYLRTCFKDLLNTKYFKKLEHSGIKSD